MKKKIIINLLIVIFFVSIGTFVFIKKARENRSWPFNSSLGHYLPKSLKYYAYKFTNTNENIIETHFYDLKVNYYSIPSSNSVGNGGGIDNFENNKVLVILDNGEVFFFNTEKKSFDKTKNFKLKESYVSIRDIHYKDSELLILGVKELNNNCWAIILDKYFKIKSDNTISFNYDDTIWMSEEYCGDILANNAGSRIVKFNNKIYISTGYFTPYIFSGINTFPQDDKSSFGKIIEINEDGRSIIFSRGHRNPQGLFIYDNEFILSTEHGPRGGDELNLIKKNNNYGWPCETLGSLYSYENTGIKKDIWLNKKKLEEYGCEEFESYIKPIYAWTPSIAASQGIQYQSDYFNIFKNNIILGSLGGLSLFRMILDEGKIINIESINVNERVRDILETQNGRIAIYSDGGSIILLSKN